MKFIECFGDNNVMDKIKVVVIAGSLKMDGISAVIMNYCTHMDLNKFDITIMAGVPIEKVYKETCREYGIIVEELPQRKISSIVFFHVLNRKLRESRFDICHVHGNSATSVAELILARLNHIKVRIMHCHNSKCQHEKIHKILLPILKRMYTQAFSCSTLAGNWIFEEGKFTVITNGFETEQYQFHLEKREQYRQQMNLEKCYVLGCVGRLNYQKNPWFVIKYFEQAAQKNSKLKLLMVGSGNEKKNIEEYVSKSQYRDRIIVYGESNDIAGLLSAMDLFLFPSRYEGLGISVVEAQISGLPCIVSENVPRDAQVGDRIRFLPIDETKLSLWEETMEEFQHMEYNRLNYYEDNKVRIEKYNIQDCAKQLEDIYIKLYNAGI